MHHATITVTPSMAKVFTKEIHMQQAFYMTFTTHDVILQQ